ncbi:MAG: hypothetical protein K1X68_04780 [Saprospiraceae bacterium]|nr:hypothetical protein [Saprospiraceae bacterium]HMW40006.1 hypothetical protein [Saprospiraceae bacterium]HMX89575.1 hypothetical protein [Saprospiraceae bacterium]HMZ41359.1 hypothetical protein [Saprospiraceae bacterium]HNA65960.1 hypothetical protein [Saprospiraceae bacterium]
MKNYKFWLSAAAVTQLLFAVAHSASLFITPAPANDTEGQLFKLLDSYRFDFGAGYHRTMNELIFVFSASLTLLLLLSALTILYLLHQKADPQIMRGILHILLIIFCLFLIVNLIYSFLVPIIMASCILVFLALARITLWQAKPRA